MNLIIVEDEPRLRNSLAYNIPWEDHGIEVVGLAANGVEALRMAERKMPDLMLIDVQMPEMDGLTLIARLKEKQGGKRFMKMIILSGHDNFAFAQQAMEHGVSRYLLKPAGEEEILKAVLEARDGLREDLEQWRLTAELERKWRDHVPSLQNHFILNWVSGKYGEREILNRSRELYMGLEKDTLLAAAVVDLDPLPEHDARFGPNDRELLRFTIRCLAGELLSHSSCSVCTDPDSDVLLVFRAEPERNPKEFMLHINASVVKLLSHAKEILKLTASAGICGRAGRIEELPQLYAEACRALQERVVYGQDIAIPYREEERRDRPEISGQQHLEKMLEIALETADEAKAAEAVEGLWQELFTRTGTSQQFQEAVLYMNSLFIRIMVKQGWSIPEVMGEDWAFLQNIHLLNTKSQTRSWLARTVNRITEYMKGQRKSSSHQIVQKIASLIEQEIDQDITLHTMADRLYVNSSYLSRLFKQEMGMAFSAYVLEQKMERAKRILQEGQKVYDAARQTGYRDVSYFTKVFRKYWGVNPGEFKP
ncbi:response regulator [Paenibacillus sp. DMB20]|uniref:response regulator n=1 Tax=Paenibacillus sp. DMB20 TaxID=1642570 RepID=UPI0006280569|nr:response regulator [Paenibacillus sp. DMB20]KKO51235.1 response regulator [Paenibacillus sp. DMB20]